MIIRKIIILTVLGGQAIFLADLLLHIFLSCITQLEARAEREEVENSREKRDRGKGDRGAPEDGRGTACVGADTQCVCVVRSKTDKERQKARLRQRVRYVLMCARVCLYMVCGRNSAVAPPNNTAADEACRPPDEHSDHSSESL